MFDRHREARPCMPWFWSKSLAERSGSPTIWRLGTFCFVLASLAASAQSAPRAQASAEEVPERSLPRVEFDAAIERALEKNPTVAEAATAVRRAEALLEQARAANRPNLSAAVSNSTVNRGIEFSGSVVQPKSQTTLSATASVPVLSASSWAAAMQSRDQIEIAQLSVAEVRQRVAVSAAEAYLAVVAAKRQLQVEQRALENSEAHLDYARKRLENGAGSLLDEVRAAQQVSTEQVRLENSALALFDSQEALGALLAEAGPVDIGAEPVFEVPEPVGEASWMIARPDFRLQAATIKSADRVLQDSWKDWLPTGTLGFTPQWLTPAGSFQESSSWRLTLAFTQPIFDGGRRRSDRALRDVELEQAKLQQTAIEIQARSEVRVARESLASYRRALATARKAADQAQRVVRITNDAFRLGATTNLEVIDAERSARDAATAAAQGEDRVRQAELNLLVALGLFPK